MALESMSPADIKALTNNDNGGLFGGGNGAWFLIILFLFAFLGWGGGGFGGGGGVQENYVLTTDFATIERKLDGVNNGLCQGFYQEAQLINGVNQNMSNGFANAELARANAQSALMNQLFQMQMAQQNCCCESRQAIAGVNYNMSTNTRDVMENQNANTRAILDALNAQRIEAKDNRIAELTAQVQALNLTASQVAQNSYLVDKLGYHCPQAAYVVQPPQPVNFPTGCGCNCGYNNI